MFTCALQISIGIWKSWLFRRGKTGVPGEKPLGARTRTNYKLNPHMMLSPGVEPGPHWWEASVLTTAPSLLPTTWFHSYSVLHARGMRFNEFTVTTLFCKT